MLAATVQQTGVSTPVRLVNVSASGLSVIGELPSRHSAVTVYRNGLAIRSRVAWAERGRGGLRAEDPVDVADMLRAIPAPAPRYIHSYARSPLRPAPLRRGEQERLIRCANLFGIRLPT
jgi:hypothetical protein